MRVSIFFDGACNNHQTEAQRCMGIGVAVFFDKEYQEEYSRAIGVKPPGTSNVAEWIGCVEAYKIASSIRKHFGSKVYIQVYSDSQVITNQFNGSYAVNKQTHQRYYKEAKRWAKNTGCNTIRWIARELNKQADHLSKEGLKLVRDAEVHN